jgi:hypothetical protein
VTLLDRLERHLARFAIPRLIRYVVVLNGLVFILLTLDPKYVSALVLDREAILQGQVWRLVSWIFIPDTLSPIWVIFYLMVVWWTGDLLEATWGAFRLNAYYFLGMFFCVASALIFGASGGNMFLNLSLFLAVATLAPNLEILFLLVIPLKLKWVALISLLWPAYILITGSLPVKMIVIMCLGNYLIFFGPSLIQRSHENRKLQHRRSKFEATKDSSPTLHRCEACGITEAIDPHADFRVASDGKEYCTRHLPNETIKLEPDRPG